MITLHSGNGIRGKTVLYSIPNFRVENEAIKFDAFKFYTPEGNLTNTEGDKYFDVPGDEISIQRDPALDYELVVTVTLSDGIVAHKTFEGIERDAIRIGLEGDIIIDAFVPSDDSEPIEIIYREYVDG